MPVIHPNELTDLVSRIFQAAGAPVATALLVARSLVASDQAGHESHGVVRVRQYLDAIEAGRLLPAAEPVIARETAVATLVDARRAFGQLAARAAIDATIARVRAHGLAVTGLINANHVGRLGEWVQLAAEAGVICMAFCNGGGVRGAVAPFGGAARLLGTNPFAAAIPVAGRLPVVVDFATSIVAEGKLRVARNRGKPVSEGWILDSAGNPSTDPDDFYNGGVLLPAAGHKGYGLSLLVEFFGGLLTGHGSPVLPDFGAGNGVCFLGLAVDLFRPGEAFLADAAALCAEVKASAPASGVDEVLLPGEPEQRNAALRVDQVPIDAATWRQLADAAAALEVPVTAAPVDGA